MADLVALLEDISPENPCGDYLEYDPSYLELRKNIQGKPEDPITGESAQPPNWRDIQKSSLDILQKSKDIQVVVYLLRALLNQEGLTGFKDGLSLLHGLLEKYWEPIHPILDPEDDLDPTARVNILEELSNFESVLRPLSLVPLVDSKSVGRYSLRDIHIATDKAEVPEGGAKPDIGLIKAAFLDVPAEQVTENYQAINDSIGLVQALDSLVGEKVGIENGPDLSGLLTLLKEIRYSFDHYAETVVAEGEGEMDMETGGDDSMPATRLKQGAIGAIGSRQDVLRTIDLICKYYAENEPSSPVPILLLRAKKLVTADFLQIVQNLLPDGMSQLELIKGPDPDAEEY